MTTLFDIAAQKKTPLELRMDAFQEYLISRIAFLRECREGSKRKISDESDTLLDVWKKEAVSIQAKLEEAEICLHIFNHPDEPIPIDEIGK